MIKKLYLICLIIAWSFLVVDAQEKIFEKEVSEGLFVKEKGPNAKKFNHFYMKWTMFALDEEGAKINYISSGSYGIGYRHKRKIAGFYFMGFDLNYTFDNYNLKQESKQFPNELQHKKERFAFNNLNLELYQRFNLMRTGNMIKLYFDTGVYGGLGFAAKHITIDKEYDILTQSNKQKTIYRGLEYVNYWNYGVCARIGYNRYVVTGSYRLSNLIDASFYYPDLPPLSLGFEISFF